MGEIKKFTKQKTVDYPEQQELFQRILILVHEYDGQISLASAVGILDLAKDEIKKE